MNRLALDLELNKEDGQITDIIQVGAVIGNIFTGEIRERLSYFIKIEKPLDPFIIQLTGITDNDIQMGTDIVEVYNDIERYMKQHECSRSILTWGKGDQEAFKKQAGKEYWKGKIGHRYTDVKTLFCEYALANNIPMKAGLAKACSIMKHEFIGRQHNAMWDAYNTFEIYRKLLNVMKDKK